MTDASNDTAPAIPAGFVKVWPNAPDAVGMKHPFGPDLSADGAIWPIGSFTARRLMDGSVTDADPAAAAAPPTPAPQPATDPATGEPETTAS